MMVVVVRWVHIHVYTTDYTVNGRHASLFSPVLEIVESTHSLRLKDTE